MYNKASFLSLPLHAFMMIKKFCCDGLYVPCYVDADKHSTIAFPSVIDQLNYSDGAMLEPFSLCMLYYKNM